MAILCLICWITLFAFGLDHLINKEPVRPITFLCTVSACIVYCLASILA